jgi:hypothetical protein
MRHDKDDLPQKLKLASIHWTEGCVDAVEKENILPLPGFESQYLT